MRFMCNGRVTGSNTLWAAPASFTSFCQLTFGSNQSLSSNFHPLPHGFCETSCARLRWASPPAEPQHLRAI